MRFRLIGNFVYRIDRNKRRRVGFLYIVHQLFIFLIIHNRDDFAAYDVVISTDRIVEGRAAVEVVQDELCDFLGFLGEDADAALDVQPEDEVVNDHAAEIRTDQADHDGFFIVAKGGRQRDDHAGDGHRLSEIHAEVAVHDFCDDVQTAGGCVAGKEERKTDADDENVADHIQKRITGERLEIREHDFKHTYDCGHEDGSVDGFSAEFGTDQEESDNQEDDIQQKGNGGDGQGNEIADDERKSGAAADGDVARDHEEIHGGGDNGGADRDDEKFAYGAFVEHGGFLGMM